MLLEDTAAYVLVDPGIPPSEHHRCGDARLGAVLAEHRLTAEERVRLTESCHDAKPGSEHTLTVSFRHRGEPVKPKGLLRLATTRGKLTPVRVELDGRQEHVKVRYAAPDETVKVTVRAFLDGFRRGKIHLHLE
jgi:hypothetical protein